MNNVGDFLYNSHLPNEASFIKEKFYFSLILCLGRRALLAKAKVHQLVGLVSHVERLFNFQKLIGRQSVALARLTPLINGR